MFISVADHCEQGRSLDVIYTEVYLEAGQRRHHMIDFHQLAFEVDVLGLDRCKNQVMDLAAAARTAGVSPVLVDVLVDGGQPEVARLRALARVQSSLSRCTPSYLAA